MPNYIAHEVFGAKVREELPADLALSVENEPLAFRCGLYGPDPLLFLPGGLNLSRLLHKTWRENSLPRMQYFLQQGSRGQQSFAAGYLCHLMLDDICHSHIYALMRERGLSHPMLEVGLDYSVLRSLGKTKFHHPNVQEQRRVSTLASGVIAPVGRREYRLGLASMSFLCRQMNSVGSFYKRKLTADYRRPIGELHNMLENTVQPTVHMLGELLLAPPVAKTGPLLAGA